MAEVKLSKESKKILKLARQQGIDIKVSMVAGSYYAYAYSKKDLMECGKEFWKKIPLSRLTRDEYGLYCINKLSVITVANSQEAACSGALEKFTHRNQRIIKGVLEDHFEGGTDGIIWAVYEDGKMGYDGLHIIHAGDYLTVYDEKGEVIFKGRIFPDHKAGWTKHPFNPKYGQPCALNHWIHWTQIGWQPDDWARLFLRGKGEKPLRAQLTTFK